MTARGFWKIFQLLFSFAVSWVLISCQTLSSLIPDKPAWRYVQVPDQTGRLAHSACTANQGKLLVFGGIAEGADSPFSQQLVIYDSDTGHWQTANTVAAPSPRNYTSVLTFDQSLLIFGGETLGSAATADAYSYDLRNSRWEEHPDAKQMTPRKQATLSQLGERIVLFGGKGPSDPDDWGTYDLKSKQWSRKPLPEGVESRISHTAVPLSESELFIWGGFTGSQRRADGFILDITSNQILPVPPTSALSARANARAARVGDGVFIWGGATADGNANSGAVFDLSSRQWRSLPAIPDKRFEDLKGAEWVRWGKNGLILVGGRFGVESFNEQLWLFDAEKIQWRQLHTEGRLPGRMAHCTIPLSPQKLAVFGGIGYQDDTRAITHFGDLWILENSN